MRCQCTQTFTKSLLVSHSMPAAILQRICHMQWKGAMAGNRKLEALKNYPFPWKPYAISYAKLEMSDVPSCKQTPNIQRCFQDYKHTLHLLQTVDLFKSFIKSVMFYIIFCILSFCISTSWNYKSTKCLKHNC